MEIKKYFKITSSIQLMANLFLAIYIGFITSIVLFALRRTETMLVVLISMSAFAVITFLLGVIWAFKLKGVKIEGVDQKYINAVIKTCWIFIFPLAYVFAIQHLRTMMWKGYSDSKTKHLKKESKIIKAHLELLEELNKEGYISKMKYDFEKSSLTNKLELTIAKEKIERINKKDKK